MEEHSEGAFQARSIESSSSSSSSSSSYKGKKPWLEKKEKGKKDAAKKKFPPCAHCKKTTHLEKYCWYRPDIQCRGCNGCTHHMASEKSMFRELDTSFVSKVRIINGELSEAKGKGKAVICTQSSNKTIIELLEKGYSLIFEGKTCMIMDSFGQELVTIAMYDRSFILDVIQLQAKAHTALADESCLWHNRIGHVNYKSLSLLYKMSLVEDMSRIELNNDVCEVCQLGKQTRLPFPINKAWRAQERLQLVHTDIYGPIKTTSLNGSSCKLKCIRPDNRTEYVSQRFQKICDECGIQHQLIAIYTPHQNGVCERKNRTVLDMARCLLFEANMPNNFWAEGVNTSVYLLNRLPTNASLLEEDQNDLDLQHAEIEAKGEAARESCWQEAMEAELRMIYKNDTWELVDRPANRKVTGEEHKLYKLKKALYGLKQALMAWYDRIDAYLSRLGFEKSISEPTLYVKKAEKETLLLVSLYVDDLLVTG
ncbi:hypothetical protein PVK06_030438 [Gossypium arboreum]|uniref:Integrase catalytic domain-containing protein n=1 Tax=Gossypium arboreum TaxID=29729 RepID=A0ABR0NNA3_GOSAR|nr:hypothetical protein PVK06_030438 [Gossypium arboreum]